MHGAAASVAPHVRLRIGPCDVIVAAITFDGSLVHEAFDRLRCAEAAHVERPQIHARVAVDDPVRHHPARAPRRCDTRGESAAQVEVVERRRQADDGLAVRGDRDRSVDELSNADFVEQRDAHRGCFGNRCEALEVRREELGTEIGANAVVAPRCRVRFPATHGERAGLRLEVEVVIRVAQRRQARWNRLSFLGDVVLMLDGARGDARADHRGHFARPHARCVDHAVAIDGALVRDHASDATAVSLHTRDAYVLMDSHAARARAGRVGGGEARGIDVAVALDPRRADDALELDQRKAPLRFLGRDQVDVEAEPLGHRRGTFQLTPPIGRRREPKTADAVPARGLTRFGLEPCVELGRVAHELREVAAAAQLPDETGGVPRGAVRELQALEEHHVVHPALGEVIRDAAADRAAADDDDPRVRRKIHGRTIVDCRQSSTLPRRADG